MIVQVGSRHILDVNAKKYRLQWFLVHENYNKRIPFENDIAILFVEHPIQFSKVVKKAILVNHNRWMSASQTKFSVTGWGWQKYGGPMSKKNLMMAKLKYVPLEECSRLHKMELSPDMFCLYGDGQRDTCRGDSGGGVIWRRQLVGLTSHGDGCGKENKPSMYTNLWYHRDWIKMELAKFVIFYCQRLQNKRISQNLTNKRCNLKSA
ncbi:unnamed protein product [Spodoptera exigua]|nr:unnamed protein product [Spodoptera exigua]